MDNKIIEKLKNSSNIWTKYKANLVFENKSDQTLYNELNNHPYILSLLEDLSNYYKIPLKKHNDSKHPFHKFSLIVDFGLRNDNESLKKSIDFFYEHFNEQGFCESLIFIPKTFGGSNKNELNWIICDSPLIISNMILSGEDNKKIDNALEKLIDIIDDNGFRCISSINKFKGPGKKTDACPIANLFGLKAFILKDKYHTNNKINNAIEFLLHHWEIQGKKKYFMFGIGTDFKKLKYPLFWYNILHVVDVLSYFKQVHKDKRFKEMLDSILSKKDENGFFTPESVYREFKNFDFGQKKTISDIMTLKVYEVLQRL